MPKTLFITSLFDLAPIDGVRHRSVDEIVEHSAFVTNLEREVDHAEVITFCDHASYAKLPRNLRVNAHVRSPIEPLPSKLALQKNATQPKVTHAYVALMHAKYDFIKEICVKASVAAMDPNTRVAWIDFGIGHVAKPPPVPIADIFRDHPAKIRVHMLRYFDLADTSRPDYWDYVHGHLAGGLVVGPLSEMRWLADEFLQMTRLSMRHGRAVLDEGLLSHLCACTPSRFEYSMGDYCDILRNHDRTRENLPHLQWMVEDARARGVELDIFQRTFRPKDAGLDRLQMSQLEIAEPVPTPVVDPSARQEIPVVTEAPTVRVDLQVTPSPGIVTIDTFTPPEKKPLLGLVMIVKNEAHGIARTLGSFIPHIDTWTILDTGSTDGTQKIILNIMGLAGKKGRLYEEPFVDFATSRNRALDLHANGLCTTVFTIMPDADNELVPGKLREKLETLRDKTDVIGHEVTVKWWINGAETDFTLPLVLRVDRRARYQGVVHEGVFESPLGEKLDAIVTHPRQGKSSRDRYERDRVLLEADLEKHPNSARSLFYLAQTYECLSLPARALELYRRRMEIKEWHEEQWEAQYRAARIMDTLKMPWPEVMAAYLACHQAKPHRAEPLFRIAEYYFRRDDLALAYVFADRAANIPPPAAAPMGWERDIYAWRAHHIVAHAGFYLPDPVAKECGRVSAKLAARGNPHDNQVRANWFWHARSAKETYDAEQIPIDVKKTIEVLNHGKTRMDANFFDEKWHASNPSIFFDNGRYLMNLRFVNYRIVDGEYLTPHDNVIYTRNVIVELEWDDLEMKRAREVLEGRQASIQRSSYPVHGFEDARLFRVGDHLCLSATVCDLNLDYPQHGPREIVLCRLSTNLDEIIEVRRQIGEWSVPGGDQPILPQKNWMPIANPENRVAKWVYSAINEHDGGTTIVTEGVQVIGTGIGHGRLRGGSQLIPIEIGDAYPRWPRFCYIALVHDVAFTGGRGRMYMHRWVLFDERIDKVIAMSDPFYFEKRGIEFCCGLAPAKEAGERRLSARNPTHLVASYSVDDSRVGLMKFDTQVVLASLHTELVV